MDVAPAAPRPRLIDAQLPAFDFVEHHALHLPVTQREAWLALSTANLATWPVKFLMTLRGMMRIGRKSGTALASELTLERATSFGFRVLEQRAPEEIVLGLVGQFWKPAGSITPFDPLDFRSLEKPGFAKAAWNFELTEADGGIILSTETRVLCSDAASRKSFGRYWRFVAPFSGLIRVMMLRAVRREAIRRAER